MASRAHIRASERHPLRWCQLRVLAATSWSSEARCHADERVFLWAALINVPLARFVPRVTVICRRAGVDQWFQQADPVPEETRHARALLTDLAERKVGVYAPGLRQSLARVPCGFHPTSHRGTCRDLHHEFATSGPVDARLNHMSAC